MSIGIETSLQPPPHSTALVRKLGSLCLMSEDEVHFLEGLQNNTVTIEKKRDFIQDGAELRTTFIVMEGWAIRYAILPSGRRQILSYMLPGDILGLHINFRAAATYSASSLTNLKLAAVDPRRILEISQKYPILASGLSWCTAREFAILGDQAVRLGRLAAKQRLAHLLLELWHRLELIGGNDGPWLDMPMTQADLADTLGLSVVHINRSMRSLREAGLVTIKRDHIRLENIDALSEMAEFNPDHLAEFSI